jgi:hypothetical protein
MRQYSITPARLVNASNIYSVDPMACPKPPRLKTSGRLETGAQIAIYRFEA